MISIKLFAFFNVLFLLNMKKKKSNMLLFSFRKSQIFWPFIFNKKFKINYEKKNNIKSKSKLFSTKN